MNKEYKKEKKLLEERRKKLLGAIHQIQEWFKNNIKGLIADGDYVIPIDGDLWNVSILEQKIWLKDKVINKLE